MTDKSATTFAEARDVLKPEEAAVLLGLGRNTVYTAVRRGDIPSARVGGRILIYKKQLEQMLAGAA